MLARENTNWGSEITPDLHFQVDTSAIFHKPCFIIKTLLKLYVKATQTTWFLWITQTIIVQKLV